jgi:hypothetical protein
MPKAVIMLAASATHVCEERGVQLWAEKQVKEFGRMREVVVAPVADPF